MKHILMANVIFKSQYRVYYNHTDAGGVVYHSKYLDFCEQNRTDFLRSKHIEQISLTNKDNLLFVVVSANIEYKIPAQLDDLLTVTIEKIEIKHPKIIFLQKIYNQNDKLLSYAEIVLVTVRQDHTIYRKVPDIIFNLLN